MARGCLHSRLGLPWVVKGEVVAAELAVEGRPRLGGEEELRPQAPSELQSQPPSDELRKHRRAAQNAAAPLATAPAPASNAPVATDQASLFSAGTSTFQGAGTSTFQGVGTSTFQAVGTSAAQSLNTASGPVSTPAGLASNLPAVPTTSTSLAPTTASAEASATSAPAKGSSQKLTPYLIAAGSVGAFVITILVLFFVYRCMRRAKKKREAALPQGKRTPSGDWQDTMSFASPSSKAKAEGFDRFGSTATRSSTESARPAPFLPPIKVARASFVGRERGDLVRATIDRHPLATLDEHAFFRSDNAPPAHNFSQPAAAPAKGGLAQHISDVASPRNPFVYGAREPSRHDSADGDESSLSSGFGESALGPPSASPANSLYVRPLDPRRSRVRSSWKLSRISWNPSNAPRTPPSSVRESVATSVGTSVESVAKFRSVHGWVDYQSGRADRSEPGTPAGGRQARGSVDTVAPAGARTARQSWETERDTTGDDVFYSDVDLPSQVTSQATRRGRPAAAGGYSRDSSRTDTMVQYYSGEDFDFSGDAAGPAMPQQARPPTARPNERAHGRTEAEVRRMDSTSTATVFRYHPGNEVRLGHAARADSVELDQKLSRNISAARGAAV
ncbi:MAG: hypothetical protein M1832_004238 [Thelocarpon impressellum]|nr:MAG: hypothetical protein M1832_004238 [Thelocarpon impressellum]